jgi:hypothetical protein
MHMRRFPPSPAIAVAVVAVVIALGGVAWASIPDGNGVIHGCYNTLHGALRLVDTAKKGQGCNKNETAISWSQTGPQGPQGPAGPAQAADGLVNPDGTFQILAEDAGVQVTVTHTGTGQYTFNATGLGTGCSLPAVTGAGGSDAVFITGGSCSPGSASITLGTADGQDTYWSFQLVGISPASTGAQTAAGQGRSHTLHPSR